MNPGFIWWLSCQAYQKKITVFAKLLKGFNFLVFHTLLPYEAEIERDVRLAHYALGVVVHPNVKIGHRVKIYHHVTLATETWIGSEHKIILEDDVMIGVGAIILGRGDQSLTIGAGAMVGANAVVTRDVLPGETVIGVPAYPLEKRTNANSDLKCIT